MEEKCSELLEWSGKLSVPNIQVFSPSDRFEVGKGSKDVLAISRLGDKFRDKFVNGNDCADTLGVDVDIYTMKKGFQHRSIISEVEALSGVNMSINLGHLWWILRGKNSNDNSRKCFNLIKRDSHANIFFVRDEEGVQQIVYVYFRDDSWTLSIPNGLPYLDDWVVGRRVIVLNNIT